MPDPQGGDGMIFNPTRGGGGGGGGAAVGTYTGDGTKTKTLTFDFEPALVIIHYSRYSTFGDITMIYGEPNVSVDKKTGKTFEQNSLQVSWNGKTIVISTSLDSYISGFNSKDSTYYYVAIPKA